MRQMAAPTHRSFHRRVPFHDPAGLPWAVVEPGWLAERHLPLAQFRNCLIRSPLVTATVTICSAASRRSRTRRTSGPRLRRLPARQSRRTLSRSRRSTTRCAARAAATPVSRRRTPERGLTNLGQNLGDVRHEATFQSGTSKRRTTIPSTSAFPFRLSITEGASGTARERENLRRQPQTLPLGAVEGCVCRPERTPGLPRCRPPPRNSDPRK